MRMFGDADVHAGPQLAQLDGKCLRTNGVTLEHANIDALTRHSIKRIEMVEHMEPLLLALLVQPTALYIDLFLRHPEPAAFSVLVIFFSSKQERLQIGHAWRAQAQGTGRRHSSQAAGQQLQASGPHFALGKPAHRFASHT